jgi:hypothetical protein
VDSSRKSVHRVVHILWIAHLFSRRPDLHQRKLRTQVVDEKFLASVSPIRVGNLRAGNEIMAVWRIANRPAKQSGSAMWSQASGDTARPTTVVPGGTTRGPRPIKTGRTGNLPVHGNPHPICGTKSSRTKRTPLSPGFHRNGAIRPPRPCLPSPIRGVGRRLHQTGVQRPRRTAMVGVRPASGVKLGAATVHRLTDHREATSHRRQPSDRYRRSARPAH